ncbi:MAG: hypothetical protein SVK08_01800 [Halobacteriota archaeon]|nr:hypothetical protein [Halobacteriota archaeon]
MILQVKDLLDAMNQVRPALAQKDLVPQMTHYIFDGEMLSAYDDQISISFPFETEFSFSVKGNDFHNIISKLNPEKPVTITKEENEVKVKQGGRVAKFAQTDEKTLEPYLDSLFESMSAEFEELPKDFVTGLAMCYPCASGDASTGILACVLISGRRIISSDRIRIGMYKLDSDIDSQIIIKASAAHKLVSYDVTHYHVSDSWVHFMCENNSVFSARLIEPEDDFPDFEYLIEETAKSKTKVPIPDKIKEIIDFTSIMSEDDVYYKKAHFTVNEDKINIKCESKGRGSASATLKLKKKITDKKIRFTINPTFLLYAVGLTKTLKFTEEKVLLQAGNFNYLLALYGDD